MTIIKIPTINDSYTGHVSECKPVTGKFGEQVAFTFANGDQLFMPLSSATNQLIRAGFDAGGNPPKADLAAVAGNTLHFSRSLNKTPGASPYYNIAIASAADTKPQTPSKRLTGPSSVPGEAPAASDPKRAVAGLAGVKAGFEQALRTTGVTLAHKATKEDVAAAYKWAWDYSDKVQAEGASVDSPSSLTAIQAGAATLLIALQKEGLVAGFSRVSLADVKQALDLEDGPPIFQDDEGVPF